MTKQPSLVLSISKDNVDLIAKETPNLSEIIHIGCHVPDGFIITSVAFGHFLKQNNLEIKIKDLLSTAHLERADSLMQVSTHIKNLITNSKFPENLILEISTEYKKLDRIFNNAYVTVGESNSDKVKGFENLITKIKHIWAAKFEPKHLLSYQQNNFDYFQLKISIPVQKFINSQSRGILLTSIFSIDTKSNLNREQKNAIIAMGKKLKKHFYFPQIVTWAITSNKIHIVNIQSMTNSQQSYLALVRHGTSEYNAMGLWAGWSDPILTEQGEKDVVTAAKTLKDINFDIGFTSPLIRHSRTLEIIKETLNSKDMPIIVSKALLERNYGEFTSKNKWEVEKQIGKKEFLKLRRSWDYPIQNGESLKDVYNRVIPYYQEEILPKLKSGKNVIISSSGNALRTLVKYLENISDENISKLEISPGEVYLYRIDEEGNVVGREVRNQHPNTV